MLFSLCAEIAPKAVATVDEFVYLPPSTKAIPTSAACAVFDKIATLPNVAVSGNVAAAPVNIPKFGAELPAELAVPLVISLNWGLLINIGVLVATYLSKKPLLIATLAAFIITGVDLVIEQVASQMDYWHFSNGIAGIQNYIGWFIISFFTSWLLQKHLVKGDKKIALVFLLLQLFFFGLIYINKLFNFVAL